MQVNSDASMFPGNIKSTNNRISPICVQYNLRRLVRSTELAIKSGKLKSKLRRSNLPSMPVSNNPRTAQVEGIHESDALTLCTKPCDANRYSIFKKNAFLFKEPRVLLQRLSNMVKAISPSPSSSLSPSTVRMCICDKITSDSNVNVSRKIFDSIVGGSLGSFKRHGKAEHANKSKRKQSTAVCAVEMSPWNKIITRHECSDRTEASSKPLMSSTPKDKGCNEDKKLALYKASAGDNLNACDSISAPRDTTFTTEQQPEKVNEKNETYELVEPKTPSLRYKLREKPTMKEKNWNQKVTRKHTKVRFICSSPPEPYSELKQINDVSSSRCKDSLKKNILKLQIASNFVKSRTADTFTSSEQQHRQSHSAFANLNTASTTSLLYDSKNPDAKYLKMKKVPNFAEIHRKMFANSESILDAKKRLKDRHTALTTPRMKNSAGVKLSRRQEDQSCIVTRRNSYDRFGFKIRKPVATEYIMRNKTVHTVRSKEQSRAILKGVRTNRRFELQMKLRNISLK